MPNIPPAMCEVWFKERTQPISAIRLGVNLTDPLIDSNDVLALIQNEGKIKVPFTADIDKYDLFYRSVSAAGVGKVIKIRNKGEVSATSSALDADATDDTFTIDPPPTDDALQVGDLIQVNSEYMHITSINKEAGSWKLSIDDRGVHGSAIGAHNSGSPVYFCEFSVPYTPITLSGLADIPPAPTNLKAYGSDGDIKLSWDYAGDKTQLKRFILYYDTTTGVSKTVYENTNDVGTANSVSFRPVDAFGLLRLETFYFKVLAENIVGTQSDLSNEASAAIGTTGMPPVDGLPTPNVNLTPIRSYVLEAWARWPTNIQQTDAMLKHCTIQIYRGSTQDLVSGTPSDTLLYSTNDDSKPFRVEHGVSDTLPQDYWARAQFVDINDEVSDWGGSGVFELNEESNTSDTDVPSTINMDQDVTRVYTIEGINGPKIMNRVLVGVQATVNADSVDGTHVHIERRTLSDSSWTTFSTSTGFADPNEFNAQMSIAPWIHEFELDPGLQYRMTASVHNVYGWSDWASPEEFVLSLDIASNDNLEDDTPTIDSFEVYTAADQATPAIDIGGNQAAIRIRLGDDNESTWLIYVEGNISSTWPTETEFCDETDGTLVTDSNSYTVSVTSWTGPSVTLNSLAGKVLRQGNDTGTSSGWFLQENSIGGNTAESGGAFTITLRKPYPPRGTGTVPVWSIVDDVTRNLVDYHKTVRVDLNGFEDTGANYILKDRMLDLEVPGDYYFRARAHNYLGRSAGGSSNAYIYADTSTGTYSVAGQSAKLVTGIDTDDIADDAITSTKITDGAVVADKMSRQAKSFSSKVTFTASDYNTVTWNSATVTPVGETGVTVNSGSTGNMSSSTIYYIYFDGTTTLQLTTDLDTLGEDDILLCTAWAKTDTGAQATFIPAVGYLLIGSDELGTNSVTAAAIKAGTITANEISAGTITANEIAANTITSGQITTAALTGLLIETTAGGVIRTGASGARVEITSSGLTTYDSSSNVLVNLPTSGGNTGQIYLTPSDTVPGRLVFGTTAYFYADTALIKLDPQTDATETLGIGGSVSTRWDTIRHYAYTSAFMNVYRSSTRYAKVDLEADESISNYTQAQLRAYWASNDQAYVNCYAGSTAASAVTVHVDATDVMTVESGGVTITGTTTLGSGATEYTWPTGAPGTSGYVLSSTTGGVLSWVANGGGGASALDDLSDVTITTPTTGHLLRHNGAGQFVNVTPATAGLAELTGATFSGNVLASAGTENIGASGTRFSTGYFTTLNTTNTTINGVAYTWPGSNGAGVLTNNGSGTLSWGSAGPTTFAGLDDVTISGAADHDALYYDSASGDWKNTANVQIKNEGEVAIEQAGWTWFRATSTATASPSGLLCINSADTQQWLTGQYTSNQWIIRDNTNAVNVLQITSGSDPTVTWNHGNKNGQIVGHTTTGLGAYIKTSTTATDGYAGYRMANDAQEWSVQTRTNDNFAIQNITGGSFNHFYITPTGSVYIDGSSNTNPFTVVGTASTMYATIQSTSVDSQAVLALKNDAKAYSVYVGSNDSFFIRDSTAAQTRFEITDAGGLYLKGATNWATTDLLATTNAVDLGSSTYEFGSLYLANLIYIEGSSNAPIWTKSSSASPLWQNESTAANSTPAISWKNDAVTWSLGILSDDTFYAKIGSTYVYTMATSGTAITFGCDLWVSGTRNIGSSGNEWSRGYFDILRCPSMESAATNAEWAHWNTSSTKGSSLTITTGNDAGLTAGEDADLRGVVYIKRRSTATTKAGVLMLEDKNGNYYYLHVSTGGKLYISAANSDPGTGDAVGTVVGTQT